MSEVFSHALPIEGVQHVGPVVKERTERVNSVMGTCVRQVRKFGEAVINSCATDTKLTTLSLMAHELTRLKEGERPDDNQHGSL